MQKNEHERLQAVNRLLKLELSKEKELQEIVDLAAEICQTSTALINLIDEDTIYVYLKFGPGPNTLAREGAFCDYTIQQENVLVVPDASADDRFVNTSIVNTHQIRFYAGSPLTTQDGLNLGTLCVIDHTPKQLSSYQQRMLQMLSKQVTYLLEFDAHLKFIKEQLIQAKHNENTLRSFFESSSSYHLLIGLQGEVLAYNKAMEQFVERVYQIKINLGMRVVEYVQSAYVADFKQNYETALKGKSVHIERQISYTKESIWMRFVYEPAHNADGEIIGVSFNATDINQKVEQERTVMAQNKSLQQITYIQSHEFRRPVASILGLMNILKMNGHTNDIAELQLMDKAVEELDQKIRLVIDTANNIESSLFHMSTVMHGYSEKLYR